jgi:hypothetical protein
MIPTTPQLSPEIIELFGKLISRILTLQLVGVGVVFVVVLGLAVWIVCEHFADLHCSVHNLTFEVEGLTRALYRHGLNVQVSNGAGESPAVTSSAPPESNSGPVLGNPLVGAVSNL